MLRIAAIFALWALLSGAGVAQTSQPPIPSAAKVAQPQQQNASHEPGVSPDNDGAPQNGVPVSNLTFSPEISVKTGDAATRSEQKSSSDWWLVIFTGGLLLTAIITYFALRRQADAMEGTLAQMTMDSETRAREAERQLKISEAAVKNAETQVNTAFEQTDLAMKEHGLARLQFFAANRPKLDIRFARRLSDPHPIEGRPVQVEFSVVNTGTSAATITGSSVRLDWFFPDAIPNPDEMRGNDIISHIRLAPSGRTRCVVQASEDSTFVEGFEGFETVAPPAEGETRESLFLFGWVVYDDDRGSEFGDTRTTYFCRQYDPATRRFNAVPALADWEFTH